MWRARRGWWISAAVLVGVLTSVLPGAAAGAGGPVIPGQAVGTRGVVGPGPEPGSAEEVRLVMVGWRPTIVERISTETGKVEQYRPLEGQWGLPAVTFGGDAGGLSADGRTLVLIRPSYGIRARDTKLRVLDTRRLRTVDRIALDGTFSFDAVSPDGTLIYLVQYPHPADPFKYRVRVYDRTIDGLRPGAIVDPAEPEERMTGRPLVRRTSPDGRWAYTLYAGGEETFIHALDTVGATAACIDLEQFDPRHGQRLGIEVDPAGGAVMVLDRGDPAAIVDPQTFEVADAPADPSPSAGDEPDRGAWVGWAAAAGGLLLIAVVALGLLRARRPRDDVADQVSPPPRDAAGAGADTEEGRECELVR